MVYKELIKHNYKLYTIFNSFRKHKKQADTFWSLAYIQKIVHRVPSAALFTIFPFIEINQFLIEKDLVDFHYNHYHDYMHLAPAEKSIISQNILRQILGITKLHALQYSYGISLYCTEPDITHVECRQLKQLEKRRCKTALMFLKLNQAKLPLKNLKNLPKGMKLNINSNLLSLYGCLSDVPQNPYYVIQFYSNGLILKEQ